MICPTGVETESAAGLSVGRAKK